VIAGHYVAGSLWTPESFARRSKGSKFRVLIPLVSGAPAAFIKASRPPIPPTLVLPANLLPSLASDFRFRFH
jgi:hypothetical protein